MAGDSDDSNLDNRLVNLLLSKQMKFTKKNIKEFLAESNAIEGVYSKQSLVDAQKAWDWATDQLVFNKISLNIVLGIHGRLLERLNLRIAGKVRNCDVWIGGELKPKESKKVLEKRIEHWCKTTNKGLETIIKILEKKNDRETIEWAEKKIMDWHLDFEEIHPFEDGNGRTGRILLNLHRYLLGLPILIIHEGDEQQDYYNLFRDRRFWRMIARNI